MPAPINRREFVRRAGTGAAALTLGSAAGCSLAGRRRPNIILIVADDLGYGELGCYGQEKIRTPNIDRLAAEGMRFTRHYSGSPVCAPSRCVLLTGLHTGHAYIRGNDEMGERGDVWHDPALEGQRPLPAGTVTVGSLLQEAGYVTGAIGKWGLGGPGSEGEPNRLGFDHFYGYLCQRVAHNYYPTHLWRNGEKDLLENEYFYPHQRLPEDADPDDPASYEPYRGSEYSMDLMMDEALDFIRINQASPFFLYLPFTVPHVSLQVPDDSVAEYAGEFPETPYRGQQGYLPHRTPHAAYAAMITRMDRGIGRIMALVGELGLDSDTLVLFTSDNGPTFNGGTDSAFFASAGPLRGLKQDLYEGGIRVPLVARWPGHVPAGSTTDHLSAFQDFLPTFTDLARTRTPAGTDGLSLLPVLEDRPGQQAEHDHLYFEFRGAQAVQLGEWKGFRPEVESPLELYNLAEDVGEQNNVAADYPEIAARITGIMTTARTPSEHFPLVRR